MSEEPLGDGPGLLRGDVGVRRRLDELDRLLTDAARWRHRWQVGVERQRRAWLVLLAVAWFEGAAVIALLWAWMG